ncbi:MAG: FUSC family protein [Aeromicrobium sp.]|uniref:FUSC family protein n=1 Tax=Aeromicrobium sp. TaxID=1871063 RepID=UPI0039E3E209
MSEEAERLRTAFAELTRWQRVEVDVVRMVAAGLAMAVPFAAGVAADRLAEGTIASVGALLLSGSGLAGSVTNRIVDLAVTLLVCAGGVALGTTVGDVSAVEGAAFVVVAILATAFSSIRPSAAKAVTLAQVATVIGVTVSQLGLPETEVVGLSALGGLGGCVLTLLAHGLTRLIVRGPAPEPALPRSWPEDARRWRARLRSLSAWHYPLRLGSCLAVAMAFVVALPTAHATWILLTVILVVQRDHRAALVRTAQRGVGTALGIVLGALMLALLSGWAMVAVVAVIGAVRGHLKLANYTAYSLVMTPLVVIILGLAHEGHTTSLMVERVADTLLGCLISVVVGHALWSRVRWEDAERA